MENLKVEVEKIISGGYGLARNGEHALFIPFSLPGEVLNIEIVNSKKSYSFAKIKDIVYKSSDRINPKCPLFGYCGGCQFQMTHYEKQLELKRNIIEESMIRIGKLDVPVNPIISSDEQFHYRNKGSFQVFNQNQLGYCVPGTTKPFSIQNCPIMEKAINSRIKEFYENSELSEKIKGMKALVIRSNDREETINSTIKRDQFIDVVANLKFVVDVDTFFQVNRTIVPKWLSYIKQLILKHKVGAGLLDLYCGVGIISQFLSPYFDHVIGIEINKRLVQNGNKVLAMNNIKNAQFIIADAAKFYDYGFTYDTVIINPPRKGISYKMVKTLAKIKPRVVIYSSCNPDTFARDVKHLCDGGYKIDEIQPFDMFPQTNHSEVVGVLYLDD